MSIFVAAFFLVKKLANQKEAPLLEGCFRFDPVVMRRSVALPHAVAHAHLREDVLRVAGGRLDLAADVGHVHPQDLVVGLGLGAPQLADDEVVGQDLAGVLAQQGHDLVLVDGETGVFAVHQYLMLVVVDGQVAGDELAGLGDLGIGQGGAGVADGGADAGQQFRRAEGLHQIVVCAVVQGLHLVMLVISRGNHHHRQIGPLAHGLQHLHAVHVRQSQIQHDHVRAMGGDHGQGLLATADDDGVVAVGREDHGDEVADGLLILHDQDLVFNLHRRLLSWAASR